MDRCREKLEKLYKKHGRWDVVAKGLRVDRPLNSVKSTCSAVASGKRPAPLWLRVALGEHTPRHRYSRDLSSDPARANHQRSVLDRHFKLWGGVEGFAEMLIKNNL